MELHRRKHATIATGREPESRFARTGLFRYLRHPIFFFEQAQWRVVFGFGTVAAGSVTQWTVLGAVLLTALFVGSTVSRRASPAPATRSTPTPGGHLADRALAAATRPARAHASRRGHVRVGDDPRRGQAASPSGRWRV
ncbi:DUF1295 domain-containing protein [Micromonospora cremea]|uniref:DUF1295 domain-containing protein n=1 Tax=Micromonospora cremea TaxID=709881 RepID=UPI00094149BB